MYHFIANNAGPQTVLNIYRIETVNLLSKNISLNYMRLKVIKYALFHYICNECIKAIHTCSKKPFHLSINFGRWFFLSASHGANLYNYGVGLVLSKSSVAFFMATSSWSVLRLSRLPKKRPNFKQQSLLDQINWVLAKRKPSKRENFSRDFFFFFLFFFSFFFSLFFF